MEDERIEAEYAAMQGEPLGTMAAFILPNASPNGPRSWDFLYVERIGKDDRRVSADLAWAAQELLAACKAARHALAADNGLEVTDQPDAYNDALRAGLDSNAAFDCAREATWVQDHSAVLKQLDAVIALAKR
jgi:hypothetical protein